MWDVVDHKLPTEGPHAYLCFLLVSTYNALFTILFSCISASIRKNVTTVAQRLKITLSSASSLLCFVKNVLNHKEEI